MKTQACPGEVRAAQAGASTVRQGELAETVTCCVMCKVSRAVYSHVTSTVGRAVLRVTVTVTCYSVVVFFVTSGPSDLN